MSELAVRKLLVDLTTPFEQRWCGGDAFKSAFFNALSMSFPVGEQFFIDSVREGAKQMDETTRAKFAAETGTVGYRCRERCFANDLIMRHVGDRMIISPPLVITPDEIDILIARATKSLDECYAGLKADGMMKSA